MLGQQSELLNQRFVHPDVQFVANAEGFTKLVIDNGFAHCEIYLHGAHVTSFIPKGQDDLLWLSPAAVFKPGKSIRGGIPICWPWFGAHTSDASKGAHGFARLVEWQLCDIQSDNKQQTVITFELSPNDNTRQLWPYEFQLQYRVTVGAQLNVELKASNNNDCEVSLSEALHSYFALADIDNVAIEGLDGIDYIDTVGGRNHRVQSGDITINQETDRVYINTNNTCLLKDKVKNRTLVIEKSGSHSTVVWNPWIDKAQAMPDVNNEGYQSFVCIETANAFDNTFTLAPGETHVVSQTIAVKNGC